MQIVSVPTHFSPDTCNLVLAFVQLPLTLSLTGETGFFPSATFDKQFQI